MAKVKTNYDMKWYLRRLSGPEMQRDAFLDMLEG